MESTGSAIGDFFSGLLSGVFGVLAGMVGIWFLMAIAIPFGGLRMWAMGWGNWRSVARVAAWANVAIAVITLFAASSGGGSAATAIGYIPAAVVTAVFVQRRVA